MKKFLNGQKHLLFVGTSLAIALLVVPVMAAEITPTEKLRKAEELSSKASEMALKAKGTGSVELAKRALELVNKASSLVLEVFVEAQKKADPDLAKAAINTANKIVKAITQIITTVKYIAQISADPKTVADAKEIMEKAEKAKETINKAIQIVTASVIETGRAEPYEPPETIPLEVPPPDTETTELEVYQQEASPSQ